MKPFRYKKGLWRKTTPKGLKLKKLIEEPDGTITRDSSYVGEDAWDDDDVETPINYEKQTIKYDRELSAEDSKSLQGDLEISG